MSGYCLRLKTKVQIADHVLFTQLPLWNNPFSSVLFFTFIHAFTIRRHITRLSFSLRLQVYTQYHYVMFYYGYPHDYYYRNLYILSIYLLLLLFTLSFLYIWLIVYVKKKSLEVITHPIYVVI